MVYAAYSRISLWGWRWRLFSNNFWQEHKGVEHVEPIPVVHTLNIIMHIVLSYFDNADDIDGLVQKRRNSNTLAIKHAFYMTSSSADFLCLPTETIVTRLLFRVYMYVILLHLRWLFANLISQCHNGRWSRRVTLYGICWYRKRP